MQNIELEILTDKGVYYTIDVEFARIYENAVNYYSDGSGYPGYDSIEISDIFYKYKNVTKLNWDFEKIKEQIYELI